MPTAIILGLFWFILAILSFQFVLGALSLRLSALFEPKSTRKSLLDLITHLRRHWYDRKLPKPLMIFRSVLRLSIQSRLVSLHLPTPLLSPSVDAQNVVAPTNRLSPSQLRLFRLHRCLYSYPCRRRLEGQTSGYSSSALPSLPACLRNLPQHAALSASRNRCCSCSPPSFCCASACPAPTSPVSSVLTIRLLPAGSTASGRTLILYRIRFSVTSAHGRASAECAGRVTALA